MAYKINKRGELFQNSFSAPTSTDYQFLKGKLAQLTEMVNGLSLRIDRQLLSGENRCGYYSSYYNGVVSGNSSCPKNFNLKTQIEFPRFNGNDLENWMSKCEEFFCVNRVDDVMKVQLAAIHLESKALMWHQAYIKSRSANACDLAWDEYITALKARFGEVTEDSMAKLKALKQVDSVEAYYDQFNLVLSKLDLPEYCMVNLFLNGLDDTIGQTVRIFNPNTLYDAYSLAKLKEVSIEFQSDCIVKLASDDNSVVVASNFEFHEEEVVEMVDKQVTPLQNGVPSLITDLPTALEVPLEHMVHNTVLITETEPLVESAHKLFNKMQQEYIGAIQEQLCDGPLLGIFTSTIQDCKCVPSQKYFVGIDGEKDFKEFTEQNFMLESRGISWCSPMLNLHSKLLEFMGYKELHSWIKVIGYEMKLVKYCEFALVLYHDYWCTLMMMSKNGRLYEDAINMEKAAVNGASGWRWLESSKATSYLGLVISYSLKECTDDDDDDDYALPSILNFLGVPGVGYSFYIKMYGDEIKNVIYIFDPGGA